MAIGKPLSSRTMAGADSTDFFSIMRRSLPVGLDWPSVQLRHGQSPPAPWPPSRPQKQTRDLEVHLISAGTEVATPADSTLVAVQDPVDASSVSIVEGAPIAHRVVS